MKYTTGQITVGSKTFEATKVDFDDYDVEDGTIDVGTKTFEAHKVIGIEDEPEE